MMLYAKTEGEYFEMLNCGKKHEFRQIEGIIIENKDTGETKQFPVKNIFQLDFVQAETVKKNYPKVPWKEDLPVIAIELGDEIIVEKETNRTEIGAGVRPAKVERQWCAVGD